MELTDRELKLYKELVDHVVDQTVVGDGSVWGNTEIYQCPSSRERGFNGLLGSLEKKGLYQVDEDGLTFVFLKDKV